MSSGELLWRAVRRHRGRMIVGVLVLSLHQATEAAVPVAIGIFVDKAVASGDVQPLLCWWVADVAGDRSAAQRGSAVSAVQ